MTEINDLRTYIYYQFLLYYYCFVMPYKETLQYYSGYGVATHKDNNKKTRMKGWILYAFLWWLPFVVSLITGSLYSSYFLSVAVFDIASYLIKFAMGISRLCYDKLNQLWQDLQINFADFCEAFKELFSDTIDFFSEAFKKYRNSEKNEGEEEKPWMGAILTTHIKKTTTKWGEVFYEISSEINKNQRNTAPNQKKHF